ncbi:Cell division protein FtsI [Enhygromyxa salina]|uniref:Cell division protein FtsI n=1 Tax=Enhygromyxa salina TaxID=215803 RepID=A0A0C2CR01_9BACT|nr:penicillin-binding transpeptidase domain-containing protein [Enhygromyxa salina]KIG12130.1 Cell division protein FtsI [Enhygromyxa salina]
MTEERSARGRFGGLGAIFFLATLGGIAFYVQEQSIPEDRDELRKPATALPNLIDENAPPPLAWRDRLDLAAIALTPILEANAAPSAPVPQGAEAAAEAQLSVDPATAMYVQDLADGHRLLYTLDPVLHQAAQTIFRNREVPYAAAVVLDLRDNSVLAFAGHSSMDPQVDPLEILTTAWAPAASTFKLVTAASLVENGAAGPDTKVCFHGGLQGITDDLLKDDPKLDTRCESLSNAIAHSYNLVLAKLALGHLDQRKLDETATSLLFQTEIPFEFPLEPSPAHIPADANSRAKVAAGFWHVDLSPVHAAVLASIYARGGIYQPPHIVAQVVGPDGSDLTPELPEQSRALAQSVADQVGHMMIGTTKFGTARDSFRDPQGVEFIPAYDIAGKTGSLTGKRDPVLNYNWFIGFAPAERPEIAFAVVLANEAQWRIKAHYAARRLVQIYLERRDAIAEARAAKLGLEKLELPTRDPETGALIAHVRAPEQASKPSANTGADTDAAEIPDLADLEDELPPIPGPLPSLPGAE